MRRFVELFRARVPLALGLATALLAAGFLRQLQVVGASPGTPYLAAAAEQSLNWLLTILLIVAIISACEAAMATGWRRTFVQAALLGSFTALYAYFVGTSPLLTIQYRSLGMESGPGLFMYTTWLGWALSALLSWYYFAQQTALQASAKLRDAELSRERAQQRLLESRLQILEAQVEPRFLLETLSRVQNLYEVDVARGECALEDLIAYLRAALPQMRERASTLGREFSLIIAYLRIVSPASHQIDPPNADLGRAYAPPMVLLPIVQLALASRARFLQVRVELSPGRIAVNVDFEARRSWNPDSEVQSLRAMLQLLFGSEGRLAISTAGTQTTMSVSWPVLPAVAEAQSHSLTA